MRFFQKLHDCTEHSPQIVRNRNDNLFNLKRGDWITNINRSKEAQMHTIDLLEQALEIAKELRYQLRQEWLDGCGGVCQLNGQKWIFLDLSLSTTEQLGQVLDALQDDPELSTLALNDTMRRLLKVRKVA